ncbi:PPOX class F420-dependent oxidoreductase [Microbacterium sp. zg.Y625]|uniref:PPOX class F420-dependent oxidoreductase n=1 Tax=Microbacterium jiangjiandongii TaxID=3049071 RepID=UPI00214BEEC4|nr:MULTISPECIES: PPOX class F420-dependent oxidoreductase [unclassified Microbacterium]MCR2791886.1 PPOX class F420-dependent oxidoreductase [Microbacterium sp. zg.Y625]MCR2815289.1 PPOX class F420-dependent oxidoreductase [Microbacterium sp. zg.Y843]WIM24700.1 PPOX class F420-dependent oxidoreductase [Microbacterium sp. zg-Y625]
MPAALSDLVDSEYVLLTTFRKTGVGVGTPVWAAPDGDELLVTTGGESGKVKRLRHSARVTLTPCDVHGNVAEGAPTVEATAVVRTDDETMARLDRALKAKYGMKYTMIRAAQKVRRTTGSSVAVVIS